MYPKLILIIVMLLLTSCSHYIELPKSIEKEKLDKIEKNKIEANKAKKEYQTLQAKSYNIR